MSDGVLVVDKPSGPTSFAAVARARRLYGTRRVGHAGTLDPMASGVLLVLVGRATRLSGLLMGLDKEYVAEVTLGVTTDSYDAEGQVVARADEAALSAIGEERVREALGGFVGRVMQRPPAFSAIKSGGRRLYAMARAGLEVEPEAREVRIDEVALLDASLPTVRLRVRCGKGTYIRSLAHDLGALLGVGGHLSALRRTRVGGFLADHGCDPFSVDHPPPLVGLAAALSHLPSLRIDAEGARRLRMGQQAALAPLLDGGEAGVGGTIAVLDEAGELVAVVESADGRGRLSLVIPQETGAADHDSG